MYKQAVIPLKRAQTKKEGFTLLELIIAMAILAITMMPILYMYTNTVHMNVLGHKITIATFTAQLKMEELVGLSEKELRVAFGLNANSTGAIPDFVDENYNGYKVVSSISLRHNEMDALALVTIRVLDLDGINVLVAEENILYIV